MLFILQNIVLILKKNEKAYEDYFIVGVSPEITILCVCVLYVKL
jgi:hypothetical protein